MSESSRSKFGLTDEVVKSSPSLDVVLEEFNLYCREKLNSDSGRGSFQLITDGQLHLRQVLHPEACRKSISLPSFFSSFYDLRKEFTKFYVSSSSSSQQQQSSCLPSQSTAPVVSQTLSPSSLSSCLPTAIAHNEVAPVASSFTPTSTPNSSSSPSPTQHHQQSIQGMVNFLCLEPDASADPVMQTLQNMANVILRLINDGHKFEEPEEIHERLEPGIW